MHSRRQLLLPALLIAALALPLTASAQAMNLQKPERSLESLDQAVGLSAAQKPQALEIIKKAAADVLALPEDKRLREGAVFRERMRAEIRTLLTPAQLKKYDSTPQIQGGGMMLPSAENRVARLDATVSLTPEQKRLALEIFNDELKALLAIPESERATKGIAARQSAKEEIRRLLTSEQQKKFDAQSP